MSSESISNNNNSSLSALEKAKLLKAEREQAKQAEAAKSEAEKEAKQRELDEKYIVDKEALAKLKEDKSNIDQETANTREDRKQNILGQRAAIKEMIGSGNAEDVEFFKENKKDIFEGDEEKLSNLKSKEKDLKGKSNEMGEDISKRKEDIKQSYEDTTEKRKSDEASRLEEESEKVAKDMDKTLDKIGIFLQTESGKRSLYRYFVINDPKMNKDEAKLYTDQVQREYSNTGNDPFYNNMYATFLSGYKSENPFMQDPRRDTGKLFSFLAKEVPGIGPEIMKVMELADQYNKFKDQILKIREK